jgi:hypothetical protein
MDWRSATWQNLSWLFSFPPGKCEDTSLSQVMTTSTSCLIHYWQVLPFYLYNVGSCKVLTQNQSLNLITPYCMPLSFYILQIHPKFEILWVRNWHLSVIIKLDSCSLFSFSQRIIWWSGNKSSRFVIIWLKCVMIDLTEILSILAFNTKLV